MAGQSPVRLRRHQLASLIHSRFDTKEPLAGAKYLNGIQHGKTA
jgi:hypothetical protein